MKLNKKQVSVFWPGYNTKFPVNGHIWVRKWTFLARPKKKKKKKKKRRKKKKKKKKKRQQISGGWGGEIRNRCLPLLELY